MYIHIYIFIPWVSVKNVFIVVGRNIKRSESAGLLDTIKGVREREGDFLAGHSF
jgi:hypothetical protein